MIQKRGKLRVLKNVPVTWLHQSTTYMDRSELVYHLLLNLVLFLVFYFLLDWSTNLGIILLAIIAGVSARTTNFILNDHFCEIVIFSFSSFSNGGRQKVAQYLINSDKRLSKCKSIYACTIYGSIVRGRFNEKSDLDIRYVRHPGFFNAIFALSFAVCERVIAVFNWIPLDLYVGDTEKFLDKMRADEIPIIIKDSDGNMKNKYPNYISFEMFLKDFTHNNG
jgi:predicted nucleotidyltransferase